MKKNLKGVGLALTCGAVLLAGACNRRDDRLATPEPTPVTSEPRRDLDNAGRAVERGVDNAGRTVEHGVDQAGRVVNHGVDQTGRALGTHTDQAGPVANAPAPAGATMAFSAALDNIAEARCQREQRCNHIGTGQRYESLQACRTVVRNEFSRDINPNDCRGGIDRTELNECMREVREEDCGNPIDTLQRVAACRTADLCNANRSVSMR